MERTHTLLDSYKGHSFATTAAANDRVGGRYPVLLCLVYVLSCRSVFSCLRGVFQDVSEDVFSASQKTFGRRLLHVAEDAQKVSFCALGDVSEDAQKMLRRRLFCVSGTLVRTQKCRKIESRTVQNGCRRIDCGSHSVIARYAPLMRPAVWHRIPAEPGRSLRP